MAGSPPFHEPPAPGRRSRCRHCCVRWVLAHRSARSRRSRRRCGSRSTMTRTAPRFACSTRLAPWPFPSPCASSCATRLADRAARCAARRARTPRDSALARDSRATLSSDIELWRGELRALLERRQSTLSILEILVDREPSAVAVFAMQVAATEARARRPGVSWPSAGRRMDDADAAATRSIPPTWRRTSICSRSPTGGDGIAAWLRQVDPSARIALRSAVDPARGGAVASRRGRRARGSRHGSRRARVARRRPHWRRPFARCRPFRRC